MVRIVALPNYLSRSLFLCFMALNISSQSFVNKLILVFYGTKHFFSV